MSKAASFILVGIVLCVFAIPFGFVNRIIPYDSELQLLRFLAFFIPGACFIAMGLWERFKNRDK